MRSIWTCGEEELDVLRHHLSLVDEKHDLEGNQTERFKANRKVKAITNTTQETRAVSSAETKAPADLSL